MSGRGPRLDGAETPPRLVCPHPGSRSRGAPEGRGVSQPPDGPKTQRNPPSRSPFPVRQRGLEPPRARRSRGLNLNRGVSDTSAGGRTVHFGRALGTRRTHLMWRLFSRRSTVLTWITPALS